MHAHLSLERICGPDPLPEFRYCVRCDNDMPRERVESKCADCVGVQNYLPRGRDSHRYPAIDPAYEISLHFPTQPENDPTIATLDALDIPRMKYTSRNDPIEVAYAVSLFNPETPPKWPIVLITSHGQVIDFWAGFDLAKLNRIPAALNAAIKMSQTPYDFVTRVPVERKQEAA